MISSVGLWISVALVLSFSLWNFPTTVYGQTTPSSSKTISSDSDSVVSVSSSVTVQVSNETLKVKDGMLKSAVVGFLNSGPNVLKTPVSSQPNVKTTIKNQVNNATQSVEGIEATNAILGIEVSKALKTMVTNSDKPGQSALVTIQTSSTCKPSTVKLISCENSVTLK